MAASGATPIILYHSTTGAAVPSNTNLAPGELAVNIADMKLYCENDSGVVTLLASAAGSAGDVVGPGSATDGAIVAFDGTTGKLIKAAVLGTGVQTALGVNTGSAGAVVLFDGALGTPSSGTLSSCTADGTNAVGFKNIPAIADKTAAYTLATGDVGKVVGVGSGGSIEIPDATFAAGDAVLVFNNTTGDVTITCTITTAYIAGADADVASVTLATRGVCNILFLSGTACVLTGNIA
jgi:hypothetical protein